jgi:hypothetical protein
MVIDEKKALLDDMLQRNVTLFFTHDTQIAAASVQRDDKGKYSTTHEQALWLAHSL